jgi:hypothetical protein
VTAHFKARNFGFPQYKPLELHTDASMLGFGAVLYQEQDNKKRVIAYASRGLSKSKKNYPVHKLEFLALKWAVTEKRLVLWKSKYWWLL